MHNTIANFNKTKAVREKIDAVFTYVYEIVQDDIENKCCSTKEISEAMGYSLRCTYRYLKCLVEAKLLYKGIGSRYYILLKEDKDEVKKCDNYEIYDDKLENILKITQDLTHRINTLEYSLSKYEANIALDSNVKKNSLSFRSNFSKVRDITDLSHWIRMCGKPTNKMVQDWREYTAIGRAIYGGDTLLVNYIKPEQIEYSLMASYILLWCRYNHYGLPSTESNEETSVMTSYQKDLLAESIRFVEKFTIQDCKWHKESYILTEHWKRIRRLKDEQVKKKYGKITCEMYGSKHATNHHFGPFDTHHWHYDSLWKEDITKDLAKLCRKCHNNEHGITSE